MRRISCQPICHGCANLTGAACAASLKRTFKGPPGPMPDCAAPVDGAHGNQTEPRPLSRPWSPTSPKSVATARGEVRYGPPYPCGAICARDQRSPTSSGSRAILAHRRPVGDYWHVRHRPGCGALSRAAVAAAGCVGFRRDHDARPNFGARGSAIAFRRCYRRSFCGCW